MNAQELETALLTLTPGQKLVHYPANIPSGAVEVTMRNDAPYVSLKVSGEQLAHQDWTGCPLTVAAESIIQFGPTWTTISIMEGVTR